MGGFVDLLSNMVGLAITGMSHYSASKVGIVEFMRGLANDVANDGSAHVLQLRLSKS